MRLCKGLHQAMVPIHLDGQSLPLGTFENTMVKSALVILVECEFPRPFNSDLRMFGGWNKIPYQMVVSFMVIFIPMVD